jgi:iron complex outermembrane receptor protein
VAAFWWYHKTPGSLKQDVMMLKPMHSVALMLTLIWTQTGLSNAAPADVSQYEQTLVTGSRLPNSGQNHVQPVTIITREDIELSGESNLADLIRNTPFNMFGSFRPTSGSSSQSLSGINLRGVGSSRSLVLIDGRKLPLSPSNGLSHDLSTIPMGAVERIEILPHAASAIYGPGAQAGVINIITRSEYEGALLMLGGAEVSIPDNGGEREEGTLLFGASGDRSKIIMGVSWNDREIVYQRDVSWTNGTGSSLFGNNFSITGLSGFVSFNYIPTNPSACYTERPGFFMDGGFCRYDFTQVSAEEASLENRSFYAKASHQINDQWSVFAHAAYYTTHSFGRFAPVPDSRFFDDPNDPVYFPLSVNSPNNPTNPLSPLYNPDLGLSPREVDWFHRFDALGPRDSTVDTQLADLTLGSRGRLGQVNLEFGIRYSNNRMNNVSRNHLLRSVAQQLIESGAYDLSNPYADPEILDRMRITLLREGRYDQNEWFGKLSWQAFELPHGPVPVVLGFEYREEIYADLFDPQSETGAVGGSAGNSAAGERTLASAFFESTVPLGQNLDLMLAGRLDDHSDFATEFTPRLGVRWQPGDHWTLQGFVEQGHHIPNLNILNRQPSTSSRTVTDPSTCISQGLPPDCRTNVISTSMSNPLIQAEEFDHLNLGVVYQPVPWLNLELNYWHNKISNRIRSFSSQYLIDFAETLPPGLLGCERNASGAILRCFTGFGNRGTIEYTGVDFSGRINYPFKSGQFKHQLNISHYLTYSVDDNVDLLENPGFPEVRASLSNSYSLEQWQLAYQIHLIGRQNSSSSGNSDDQIPTWVTHDVQLNYHTPWNSTITVGVQNINEKQPPLNSAQDNFSYNSYLYNGFGRISYLRYSQRF